MRWNRDVRYAAGGFWRCGVRKLELSRAQYHRDPGPKRARMRAYYHDGGGYEKKRRRELAGQRATILGRLAELEQEAVTLAQS